MLEVGGLKCKVDGCVLVPAPHGAGVPDGSLFGSHCGAVHTPEGEKWFPAAVGQTAADDMIKRLNARLLRLESSEVDPNIVVPGTGDTSKSAGSSKVK